MISERYIYNGKIPWNLNAIQKKYRDELLKLFSKQEEVLVEVKECYCGSKKLEKLAEKDRFGFPINSFICRDCGLIFCSPRLSEEFIPRFYKEFYYPLTFGRKGTEVPMDLVSPQQGYNIFEFCKFEISKLIKNKKTLNIGEIGCASGNNLFQVATILKKMGYPCTLSGCDYAEYYTKYKKNGLTIDYYFGGPEVLIQSNKKFDFLILSHVLEHIIDLKKFKRDISKLLANNGLLYIEVPGILDLKSRYVYDCDLLKYLTLAHIYNFSLTTLRNVMTPEFELVKGDEYSRALFRRSQNDKSDKLNDYFRIINYLKDLEVNLEKYNSLNPDKKLTKRIKRKFSRLKRIFFRVGI